MKTELNCYKLCESYHLVLHQGTGNINIMTQVQIEIGNKLPTVYDVVHEIYSYSTQPGSKKMNDVIHKYALALVNTWEESCLHCLWGET